MVLDECPTSFKKCTNVACLIPILENRLPKSCNVYNMAQMYLKFQNEMTFYIWSPEVSESNWIIATCLREDYGMDINISAPQDQTGICSFKEALISSKVIDWTKPFVFAAIDQDITFMVKEVIFETMGKQATGAPNIMYYANSDTALQVDKNSSRRSQGDELDLEVKSIDPKEGAEYLADNWKFTTKGSLTYIRKLVERNGSAGVFKNGKLIAGVTLNGSGLISMLNTLPDYRLQGYGLCCMKYFIEALDKQKIVPCCTVELANYGSMALQRTLGLIYSHNVFYISRPE